MTVKKRFMPLSYAKATAETLTRHIRTGRHLSDKLKILAIFLLRTIHRSSPSWLKEHFDSILEGALIETDIKFSIRTLHDFFVISSLWEEQLTRVFKLGKGMTFLDVGAHIGRYTLRAGMMVGKEGKIIAVEPNRDNFDVLVRNIALNRLTNCIPLNLAAYSSDTELDLFHGPSSAEHSIKEDFGKGSQKVKSRALDNVLEEIGVKKVDMVKIDVEGAELEVLRGMEKTLTRDGPALIIEVVAKDEGEIIEYLNHLGYKEKLLHFYPNYREGLAHYLFKKSEIITT